MQEDFLNRRQGESAYDYAKRILYARLVDRTIQNDYTELARLVFGKAYAPDVARRMAYGAVYVMRMIDKEQEKRICSTDILAELEEKRIELQKEKQRYFDQRREYMKHVNASGRDEHLRQMLKEAAASLPDVMGQLPDMVTADMSEALSGTEAVLVLSDWHYGMTTDNIYNVYNTDVCIDRVLQVVKKAVDRVRLHKVSKIHVIVLGDMIHGAIHTSARVAAEELVCDQLMHVSEILAQAIGQLASVVPNVVVHITYGNHGRTVQNKNDNIHRDNMERVIPWWLKERFAQYPQVEIDEDETEFLFVNAAGHGIVAAHGDLDNVRNCASIIPQLFMKRYGENVEYVLLGDKHHRESIDRLGVTSIVCGALCGTDDYANEKRLFSTPEQLLLIVNEQDGVDAEYHIKCE